MKFDDNFMWRGLGNKKPHIFFKGGRWTCAMLSMWDSQGRTPIEAFNRWWTRNQP